MEIPVEFFESLISLIDTWTVAGVVLVVSIVCFKFCKFLFDSDLKEHKKLKTEIETEIRNDLYCSDYCPYNKNNKKGG